MKRILLPIVLATVMLLGMPAAAAASESTAVVTTAAGLNLRETPGLDSRILFTLHCGETVTITAGLDEAIYEDGIRWVQVNVTRNSQTPTGYVAFAYLNLDGPAVCYTGLSNWQGNNAHDHNLVPRRPSHPDGPGPVLPPGNGEQPAPGNGGQPVLGGLPGGAPTPGGDQPAPGGEQPPAPGPGGQPAPFGDHPAPGSEQP